VYWNTDPPQPHGDGTRTMYVSLPFWLGLSSGRCYGIFFDTVRRSDLDAGATWFDVLSFGADGGDLTYYVLAGPTPAKVLARYADITGHIPLPPRWALGYGQSRWSYYPGEMVRDIADGFRRRRIPCDSLWLDIDYMDGYRVFTWSSRRFPEPASLLSELGASGYKVVAIIDPGVKADPTDPTFIDGLEHNYFVRRADGSLFTGVVWPGESAFPDFRRAEVRSWWGERHRQILAAGVAGIWDDMNEPALTDRLVPGGGTPHGTTLPSDAVHLPDGPDGVPLSHAAFHNAYGLQMARATFEAQAELRPGRRPFVLTRSGYAGIQRYACVWTGDNRSIWEHLRLASRMCLALGLSGLPLVGFDTGGFWENADGELLVRFTQLGSVFPFFRNHSAFGTANQEPWAFGQPFEALCRRAIELRYRLLPYIYTALAASRLTGAPISRALAYAFPEDEALLNVDDEHLLGSDLLCAPVMEPDQHRRVVQFPPGAWIAWETGERIVGPERRQVESPLDVLPLFVREGAILPLGPVMQFVGELADEPLTLACYPAEGEPAVAAIGEVYEDDGETAAYQQNDYRRIHFTAGLADARVTFHANAPEGSYVGIARPWAVEFHLPYRTGDKRPMVGSAHLDGRPLDIAGIGVVSRRYETLLTVPLGSAGAPCSLEIALA
jgi:alpha-glucosidase